MLGIGAFLVLLPLVILVAASLESGEKSAAGATICLGGIMWPFGLMMFLMGWAYLRLGVEIDEEARVLRFSLPRSGAGPWFPWLVRQHELPWDALDRIDTMTRGNPLAPRKVETFYFFRTRQAASGDLVMDSLWFHEAEEIARRIANLTGAPLGEEESLDRPFVAGERRGCSERTAHLAGWALLIISIGLGSLLAAAFFVGDEKVRWDAGRGLFLLVFTLPASFMLMRYRQPR